MCCRPFAEKYEQDQEAFFKDYTAAHIKLSELGAEWQDETFTLEDEGSADVSADVSGLSLDPVREEEKPS